MVARVRQHPVIPEAFSGLPGRTGGWLNWPAGDVSMEHRLSCEAHSMAEITPEIT